MSVEEASAKNHNLRLETGPGGEDHVPLSRPRYRNSASRNRFVCSRAVAELSRSENSANQGRQAEPVRARPAYFRRQTGPFRGVADRALASGGDGASIPWHGQS